MDQKPQGGWRIRSLVGTAALAALVASLWLLMPRTGSVAARESAEGPMPANPARVVGLAARPGSGVLPAAFVLGHQRGKVQVKPDGSVSLVPVGPEAPELVENTPQNLAEHGSFLGSSVGTGRVLSGPPESGPRDGRQASRRVAPMTVLDPEALPGIQRLARAMLPMGLQQSDLIEFQPFEDETFPPEGWNAWDRIQRRQNKTEDIYTWGRETCDLDEQFGYDYAVWSSGGGTKGSLLTPCREYPEPVSSRLFYDRLNTVNYPGGLLVNFTFKLDVPAIASLIICAPIKGDESHYQCFWPLETKTEGWKTFPEPIAFTSAAGLTGAELVFAYEDLKPDSTHIGVYVDNIDISAALTLPGAPTLTPSSTPTNRPTRTPSNTPRPTATLLRPATATPPPTYTPDPRFPTVTPLPKEKRFDTFMPVSMRNIKGPDLYQPIPLSVWVNFGTAINAETGQVVGMSKQFANGTKQICAKIEWSQIGIGSRIGWTWQRYDNATSKYVDLSNDPPFKDAATIRSGNQSDFTYQCLSGTEAGGAITPGSYKVLPFINGQPAVEQYVAVVELPGSGGATSTPIGPTPTPTAEPTDDASGCRQRVENGGFEEGPAVGWGFRSTSSTRTDLAQIVIKDPVAFNSQWLAVIGGEASTSDELHSLVDITLLEPGTVLSATLAYLLRVNTDETKDGRIDDTFIPTWVNQDGRTEQLIAARITDEMLEPNTWFNLSYNIADRVVKRGTWTSEHLSLVAKNSAVKPTTYRVDNVVLAICRKPAWMQLSEHAAPEPFAAGLGLLKPLLVGETLRPACETIRLSGPRQDPSGVNVGLKDGSLLGKALSGARGE